MKWFLKVLSQYADFKGRARRKEYWMFHLFFAIFYFVFYILDNVLGTTFDKQSMFFFGWLETIYWFALIIPSLAVSVRRLHDIGKSGWYYFLILIPLVGGIILIVWACFDSQIGENKWGANPKEEIAQ